MELKFKSDGWLVCQKTQENFKNIISEFAWYGMKIRTRFRVFFGGACDSVHERLVFISFMSFECGGIFVTSEHGLFKCGTLNYSIGCGCKSRNFGWIRACK